MDENWREVQGGWAVDFGAGISATVQVTRKRDVRFNVMVTGTCETLAEALARIKFLHGVVTEEDAEGRAPSPDERLPASGDPDVKRESAEIRRPPAGSVGPWRYHRIVSGPARRPSRQRGTRERTI